MLYLIGTGLADEQDLTLKGLDAAKRADKVFLEVYTSKLSVDLGSLAKLIGKEVIPLDRSAVEEGTLVKQAKEETIALLVIGDPLSATTHWDLMSDCKKDNVEVEVIHNASIFSAIAATGLQLYKFGKTASIPHPTPNFKPETASDLLKLNKSIDAHTLCLLDTQPFMTVRQAIDVLLDIERERNEGLFTEDTLCVGCARIGAKDQVLVAGKAKDIQAKDFGRPVHCLVVPARLHFVEEEALQLFQ